MSTLKHQQNTPDTAVGRDRRNEPQHFFYHGDELVACIGGRASHRLLRTAVGTLAQSTSGQTNAQARTYMIDRAGSVLGAQDPMPARAPAYTAYGYAHGFDPSNLAGFNGAYLAAIVGQYPLGAGRRFYSPTLMRFSSPDALSPFLAGGINAYAYCQGDPVNGFDPSGNAPAKILSKSKHPNLFAFLGSEEGQQYRLYGSHDFGGEEGVQSFGLVVKDDKAWYRTGEYHPPKKPFYVSKDGRTSFSVLMHGREDTSKRSSLLTFDDEFRRQGFSLRQPILPFVLVIEQAGRSQRDGLHRSTSVSREEAYAATVDAITPTNRSWLAPMIDKVVNQVRSGDPQR